MRSPQEIEEVMGRFGALVALGDRGPFAPDMREVIHAVINTLAWVMADGSPHNDAFQQNVVRLQEWCESHGVVLLPPGVLPPDGAVRLKGPTQ